jgi:hypothetical protein
MLFLQARDGHVALLRSSLVLLLLLVLVLSPILGAPARPPAHSCRALQTKRK